MGGKSGFSVTIEALSLGVALVALVFSVFAYNKAEFPRRTSVFEAQVAALKDFEVAQDKFLDEGVQAAQGELAKPPRQSELRSAIRHLQVLTQERYAADLNALVALNEEFDAALVQGQGPEAMTIAQTIETRRSQFERKFAEAEIRSFAK